MKPYTFNYFLLNCYQTKSFSDESFTKTFLFSKGFVFICRNIFLKKQQQINAMSQGFLKYEQ